MKRNKHNLKTKRLHYPLGLTSQNCNIINQFGDCYCYFYNSVVTGVCSARSEGSPALDHTAQTCPKSGS
jgi:hypothetical protein